ncbi:MAG: adenylylsulfate kinase [Frankiaceae bacterium]|jgi:adenylylsulfate kinase-like enzyme|nr:adenylylsulfate kinase [Frankiaceae bacterium]
MRPGDPETVLITGGLGVGKTSVSIAVGDLLEAQGDAGCVVDLDWLCWAWSPTLDSAGIHRLLCDNVRAVMPRLLAGELSRVVLCRAMLNEGQVEALRAAVGLPLRVVRLTTSQAEVERRLRQRDSGETLRRHLDQLSAFARAAEQATPDAIVIDTTKRTPEHVAAEVLALLGWTSAQSSRR